MVRQLRVWFIPTVAVLVLVLAAGRASVSQEPKTTTEKLKEKAGNAVTSVKKGVSSAGDAIKNKFHQAKGAVVAMGIEARVYSRLHWDKGLTGSKIDLSAPREGVIVLTGGVADAATRARAIALTTDTVGVTEVVDHLTVLSATHTPAVK